MVAVVSGSGLGLFGSSASQFGGGADGKSNVGRGRDQIYVNSTNGNLIVQSVDETLSALGLDFAGVRTYNSQGLTDEDNNDQWRLGVHQKVVLTTGVVNQAGSVVTKTFGDGAQIKYTWSTTRSRYESGDGDGANDYLIWDGTNSRWTWTDGSSRATEEYWLINGVQRIKFSRDADGNSVTYNYNAAGLLTSLNMAGSIAQTVVFTYSGAAGTNLDSIRVDSFNGTGTVAQTQTLTRYYYDTSNRLKQVVVDLTPTDNTVPLPDANSDGYYEATAQQTYVTTYTYDGVSKRIASITQTDGSSVGFTYQDINGDFRLKTATDAEGRLTTFTYADVIGGGTGTPAAWSGATALEAEPAGSTASAPQVAFDSSGNGFAIWTVTQTTPSTSYTLKAARYTRATNSWVINSTPLYTSTTAVPTTSLAVDSAGNALVAWLAGGAISAVRYTAGAWGTTSTVVSSGATGAPAVSINGNFAAIIWGEGSGLSRSAWVSRWTGTAWGTKTNVENQATAASELAVAVDNLGNVIASWTQVESGNVDPCVWTNQYRVSTSAWTGPVTRDFLNFVASAPQVALDANGNGIMFYQQGGALYASRYTRSNNSWTAPSPIASQASDATQTSLSIDASGNAVLAWVQDVGGAVNAYASIYTASNTTFGPATLIEALPNAVTSGSLRTSISGARASATWIQNDGTRDNAYAAIFDGTWQPATLIEASTNTPSAPAVAMDSLGGVSTLWIQSNGTSPSVYTNRFTPASSGGGGGTPAIYQTVTVTSPNASVVYKNDTQGRLATILRSTGGTTLETRYAYDAVSGNVLTITEDPTGLNRVTTFGYDAVTGALLNSRDSLGNTVARTYNTFNQLLTETRYTVPDPDGSGPAVPSGALTTRYAYDGEHHLRFVISADGRVTEHQYNAAGQRVVTFNHLVATYTATPFAETDLITWAGGAGAGLRERIDYRYDWRGALDRISRWATTDAAGVGTGTVSLTQFVYDQRGQLLQTIDPRGSGTAPNVNAPNASQAYAHSFTYDGLGRVLTNTEWLTPAVGATPLKTRISTNTYDDVNRQTQTVLANGLLTIAAYNRAGELVGVTNGTLGSRSYVYDGAGRLRIVADPATGVRQFSFYDDAGRLVGSVDGDGTLTELIYDKVSQLIKTVRHSTLLSAATLASLFDGAGNPTAVTFASLRTEAGPSDVTDQVTRRVYDNAGRLVYSIDEIGAVTKFSYDGANRLVQELQYTNTISIARSTDQVLPADVVVTTHADDRLTRHFYDNSDNRVATLDGAGYLAEFTYDNAGQLMTRFERANVVAAGLRAAGTLAQLQTSAGTDTEIVTDPEVDITTQYYYDQQGRLVGELDGEGFYTKTNYDVAGNATSTVRYDFALTYTSRQSQATIETALVGKNSHTTTREFDGASRLVREIDFQSTVAEYEYDNDDHLVSERLAAGDPTDERWTARRYDELGRLIRELTAEGKAAVVALGANPTQAAVDNLWNLYGVLYAYDTGGRRISATARPDATQTNVTRYYYDNDGRLRFEVNQLGERKEYRYNALGQLTDELKYINTISTSGLNGGLLTSALITTLTQSADATKDAKTTYTYTLRGELASKTTIEGATVATLYNTFGELRSSTPGAAGFVATTYDYTARGELKTIYRGGVQYQAHEYDAFGRLTKVTDGRGKISKTEYDRLGRQVATVDALGGRNTVSYDGYSRLKFTDDATTGTNNTSYVYDDVARKMTVDTPEGVRVVTTFNRVGDISNVTIGTGGATPVVINTKSFTYDKNGQVLFAYENGAQIEARTYDRGGRQITQVDGRGTTTTIVYNAANRTFTSTVDSVAGGLRLITTYTYDGQGRIADVTDPRGLLTRTTYDRDGRVTQVALDPSGLNLRTTYTYDTANNTLTVTEGFGTSLPHTTQYKYDTLGRRSEEIVDPSGLNLRMQFKYDNADNMTRKIDSRLFSCWYVYDDKNRLTHKIDALGGVTQMTYDAMDRVAATRHYANYLSAANLTTLAGADTPTTANFTLPTAAGADALERSFYDKDGRETYTIDGVGTITQRTFDAMGNVTRQRRISATQLPGGSYADAAAVATALGSVATTLAVADQVSWAAFDERGRAEFVLDSMNGVNASVQRLTYDGNGNVIARREYFTARAISADNTLATLRSWSTANLSATNDHLTLSWYDTVDRQRYVLDADGYLTQTIYNDTTRATQTTRYATRPTGVSASSTIVQVGGAIVTNAKDVTTIDWVDASGRARFSLDAEGYLGETQYNDTTGAVTRIAYAAKPSSAPTIGTALATVVSTRTLTAASDRSVTTWVDAAYRQRFVLDGEQYLTETRYNDATGSNTVYVYGLKQAQFNSTSTLANLTAANAITVDAKDQNTREDFDAAGRLWQVADSDSKSEYFVYDAAGNKTKYVNKKATGVTDAANTWTFEYDANHRLTYERGPSVSVTSVDPNTLIVSETTVSLVTHNEYDAFGNVSRRTEAEGIASQARVTSYEYDALGHQTATISPTVGVYDSAGDNEWGNGATVLRRETQTQIRSETSYDVFGNAYRNRLVTAAAAATAGAGAFTYKAYDNLGRVKYEVDAKNQVTSYTYDAFDNKTQVTRYTNTVSSTTAWQTATSLVPSLVSVTANSSVDRTIATIFDRLGRALSVKQPSVRSFAPTANAAGGTYYDGQPSTEYVYDAFGGVTRTSTQINTVDFAHTYSYYDRLGRKSAELDPNRYLTLFEYDETGDLTRQVEYARPTTGTLNYSTYGTPVYTTQLNQAVGSPESFAGYDRETTFTYDKLNRKTSESKRNLEYANISAGTLSPRFDGVQTTSYGYDVLGNQTRITDALGGTTYNFFDVLGRLVATAGPAHDLGFGTAKISFTRMGRDANGNLVQSVEYFNGLASNVFGATPPDAPPLPTLPGVHGDDRTTLIVVDGRGNATRTRDASGADHFASYDTRGAVAKDWQVVFNPMTTATTADDVTETIVKLYRYDAVGQTTSVVESQRYNGVNTDSVTRVAEYNAFGEITYKYNQGTADVEKQFFDYDQAGRVWRTSGEDGVDKVYMYDLAGNATLELRSKGTDLSAGRTLVLPGTYTSAQSVVDDAVLAANADLLRMETVYDAKGNVVQRRTPSYDVDSRFQPVATDIAINTFSGVPYVYWTAPPANMGATTFWYRLVGSTGNYTQLTIESVPGGKVGVNVGALPSNQSYEFRLTATFAGEVVAAAESLGTFRVDRATVTNYTILRTPPDPASEVGTISVSASGPTPVTLVGTPLSESWYTPSGGTPQWGMLPNRIDLSWAAIGSIPVRIMVDYYKKAGPSGAQGGLASAPAFDRSAASTGAQVEWYSANPFATQGGFHSIFRVRVFALNADGTTGALLRETGAAPPPPKLIWVAPNDPTITAVFRYKLPADSGWSSVTATRFGTDFQVDVQNLLIAASNYDYEIEHWRGGAIIAKKAGQLNSTGVVTTRTASGSIVEDPLNVFSQSIATPAVSGLDMVWAPPTSAYGSVTPTFEYRPQGGAYSQRTVSQGANWGVYLGDLAQNTTFEYQITYTLGNRMVAQQRGTFVVQFTPSSTTTNVTASTDSAPAPVPNVAPLSGSNGVAPVTIVGPLLSESWYTQQGGTSQWGMGVNRATLSWAAIGASTRVKIVIQYYKKSGPAGGQGGIAQATRITTNASTGFIMDWTSPNPTATQGGLHSIFNIYVYAVDAADNQIGLLRQLGGTGTVAPPSLTWTAPDISLTARFWAGGVERTVTRNGSTLSVDLTGLAAGTYSYEVGYYRSGDPQSIVYSTGTFTTDNTSSTVPTQSYFNRNPAWIGVSAIGNSASWSRVADQGQTIVFEYWNGSSWVAPGVVPAGDNTNFSVSLQGVPSGSYQYRLSYANGTGVLPYVRSTGTINVTTTVISNTTELQLGAPNFNQAYPPVQITPVSLTNDVASWSYPKQYSAGDTITFRYTVGGTTYTAAVSGSGPAYSAQMSALPFGSNQAVTWQLEYTRAGESSPYALANGRATMTVTGNTTPPTVTVNSQNPVYPSGVAEISTPYDLAGGYLAWDTPANGATVTFTYNGIVVATEAYGTGRRVNLSSLSAGTYSYEITYRASPTANPHARAIGTFTVVKNAGGIANMTLASSPARVDTAMSFVPTIGTANVVNPPWAAYHLVTQTGTTGYVLAYGAKPWAQTYGVNVGGFYYSTYPNSQYPDGIWAQLPQGLYFYGSRLAITIPITVPYDVDVSVDFWLLSDPGNVKSAGVSNPDGTNWVADIQGATGIANGSYGYRIKVTRQGAKAPIGVMDGTFVVGSTNSITVSAAATPAPAVATPTTKQSVDRWGNVIQVTDASNNVTDYRYNGLNLLVQTLEAYDWVYDKRDAAGNKATDGIYTRVEKTNSYDLLGRLIETQDGYDQATRVSYNGAGEQLTKRNADYARYTNGATSSNVYDIFGNLRQTQDELGYLTRYKYDKLGRLTEVWREIDINVFTNRTDATVTTVANPALVQSQFFKYDEAGRRIAETNGANETVRYRYDFLGNLTLKRSNLGYTTGYVYNADGKKTGETDGIGSTASWVYNAFGQLTSHTEFNNVAGSGAGTGGGTVISYSYNKAGQMATQTGGGQNVSYAYDRGGNLASITDSTVNRKTSYRYDIAGRQARETVAVDGRLHQDTRITYDNHNRIKTLDDPDYREGMLFDVNGNRAYVYASYYDQEQRTLDETYRYTYDEMNRITANLTYLADAQQNMTVDYAYNGRGDRVLQVAAGTAWVPNGSWYKNGTTTGRVDEAYVYDGLGRLTAVNRNLYHTTSGAQNPTNIPLRSYTYDLANRQKTEQVKSVESDTAFVSRNTTTNYDGDGRVVSQSTSKSTNGATAVNESSVSYGTGRATYNGSTWTLGFDDANTLRGYEVQFYSPGGSQTYKSTFMTDYYLSDGYLEQKQKVTSTGSGAPGPGETQRYYNANHELIKLTDQKGQNTRYFVSNQGGQILTGLNINSAVTDVNTVWNLALLHGQIGTPYTSGGGQHFFFVQGNKVGSRGEAKVAGQRWQAHFDVNSTPISENYPAATPSTVVAQAGETLRNVAGRVLGDASLWYVLAEENGLTDPDADLPDGMQLRIPNDVISLSNTSNSFKPFSITDAIGDTTPTQPPPPAPKGCGVIGMIVMIVVMIVATIFTAGAAAMAFAAMMGSTVTVAGGVMAAGMAALGGTLAIGGAAAVGVGLAAAAVGGAIGSAVSQGVGIAIGAQDKFSWSGVALGALSAGIGSGLGAVGFGANMATRVGFEAGTKAAQYAGVAINAAASNALTQGVAVATGLQKKFDWRSVAASAISAPLASAAGKAIGEMIDPLFNADLSGYVATTSARLGSAFASGVTSVSVRMAIGGKFDAQAAAADVFGNMIGNSLVELAITPRSDIKASELFRKSLKGEALERQSRDGIVPTRNVTSGIPADLVESFEDRWDHRDSIRTLASSLRDPTEARALIQEYLKDGLDSPLGAVLGDRPFFGPLMRLFSSVDDFSPEAISGLANQLDSVADTGTRLNAYLEDQARSGKMTAAERAYVTGDLSGLGDDDAVKVINTMRYTLAANDNEAFELFKTHTTVGTALSIADSFSQAQNAYTLLAAGSAAMVGVYGATRSLDRLTATIKSRISEAVSGLADDVFVDPFANGEVRSLMGDAFGMALKVERGLGKLLERGASRVKWVNRLMPKRLIDKWKGKLSNDLGEMGELALDLMFLPLTGENAPFRELTGRFTYNGGRNGIDRTLVTHGGKYIDFEVKVSGGKAWPKDWNRDQLRGADFFVPDRLQRVSDDPLNSQALRDEADDRLTSIRNPLPGVDPVHGYAFVAQNGWGTGRIKSEMRLWDKNVRYTSRRWRGL